MKAMPRTRVSLNSKAHQLGWLKTKKKLLKNSSRLISTNKLQQLKKFSNKIYNWPTMITTYQFARKNFWSLLVDISLEEFFKSFFLVLSQPS